MGGELWRRLLLLSSLVVMTGACMQMPPPQPAAVPSGGPSAACATASASLQFDFDGAPGMACAVTGEREFSLLVTPEHAPPINPSPWYAFRYRAAGDAPVSVTLRYLGGRHRYDPKLRLEGAGWLELPVTQSEDGAAATFALPPGDGTVAAQELLDPADARDDLARWSIATGSPVITLGRSHDGRAIEAIRLGRHQAPKLVVLIGRQHPPEVTGALAMKAFVDTLAERADQLGDVQVLVVPMLNPDGVARGHWRANRGGIDLNRDWGHFSQPETRAVRDWLGSLSSGIRPVVMIDFHSTRRNLFYVQGEGEESPAQARFRVAWLDGRQNAFTGYPFTVEPSNANPGSGTAKNWFHMQYAIPAYTYEVADSADRASARHAASELAAGLLEAIPGLDN